jgi:hypothetical protein
MISKDMNTKYLKIFGLATYNNTFLSVSCYFKNVYWKQLY